MARLTLNWAAILENIITVDAMVRSHGAAWTLATNVLSGDQEALTTLRNLGIRSVADTRVENLAAVRSVAPDVETWLMRLAPPRMAAEVIGLANISLNSEMATIAALDAAAGRLGVRHAVILMVEIGNLSEGIFSGDLIDFYAEARGFRNIDVLGLGGNLGAQEGIAPNVDQLNQLALYRELLELKFDTRLPFVSAGTSAVLPLLAGNNVPAAINHFRVGESVFLGTDLVDGGVMDGLRSDGAILEADVVEVKKKTLYYRRAGSSISPFEKFQERTYAPGERGYRAVIRIGQVDTEAAGLAPVCPRQVVLGAGNDLVVVDLGRERGSLQVGDCMSFRPSYRALMRLMASAYVEKSYIDVYPQSQAGCFDLPPVLQT